MDLNVQILMQMLETEELLVFSRIVATQSLSRAAKELRMPRATVSRRLAGLETKLDVRTVGWLRRPA
jgi:DNA-binding transcriptional LysR family regulator